MLKQKPILILLLAFSSVTLKAQDSSKLDKLISLPDKLFGALDKKTSSIEQKLNRQTEKYLNKLERQENKLRKKLYRKDSALAKQLFDGANEKYEQLKNTTGNVSKYASVYSGHLDSLTTALHFLNSSGLPNGTALSNLTGNPELQKTLDHYKEFQQKLNASEQIKKQLLARQQLLKEQFQRLGMVKQLKQFRKQVYYYQQQVKEYKELFENPGKLEAKLMEAVMKLPQFKDFFAKNSMLGSLFALPGSSSPSFGGGQGGGLAGLQTRAMINQSLIDRFGSGPNVTQMLQQNVQSAQGQLNELKNKVSSLKAGSYGNGDLTPGPSPPGEGGFKPNAQKTKSFLQRLEYGANVQSQKARYFFPVTSDIGLSLGYRLNDKSVIGIGASYKLGWGSSWNNIRITHQGVGLRSYVDWKIKGSFYVSGGYEKNYRPLLSDVISPSFGGAGTAGTQFGREVAWQTSGLIGVSKKYSLGKKMKGEMKLLWDFMSYRQVPKTQAILFRIGYSLK